MSDKLQFVGTLDKLKLIGHSSLDLDLDESAISGFECGLGPVAGLQLSENIRHVILYCAFGKEQCGGDFSIAGALRNKAKYFDFTFGEGLDYGIGS